jgi:hypothetical protein
VPHHVAAFEQLHEWLWLRDFISETHPGVEDKCDTNSCAKTVDEYNVESHRCECS